MLGLMTPGVAVITEYSWLWLIVAFIIVVLAWWLFKPPPALAAKPVVQPEPVVKASRKYPQPRANQASPINQTDQSNQSNQSNQSCKLSPVPSQAQSAHPAPDQVDQANPTVFTDPTKDTFVQPDSTTQAGHLNDFANDLTNVYACRPYNGSSGRAEQICRNYLERRFGVIFPTCRPLFLRNPETKQPLELDCYNEELLLAVEYQGPQHYYWPNYLGGRQTITEFVALLRRDKFKVAMCNHLGVHMIRVPYWVKNKDIPGYIEERLPERLKLMPRAFS